MAIIFAAYIPDFNRMVPDLIVQLVLLAALAAALISYNRQFCGLTRCLFAIIGGGVAGNVLVFCLQLPYGVDGDFAIGFVELYIFAVSGGCGLVVAGLTLAFFSKAAGASRNSAAPEDGREK
jgi:hypothetical protein